MIPLVAPSDERWLDAVFADFDAFLQDHAACEKKASAMAMTLVSHYPDKPELVRTMIELAQEELDHFGQVVHLLQARGLTLAPDEKDAYVRGLLRAQRKGDATLYLLDRLLVAAIVEARGHERFSKVARRADDPAIAQFYSDIAKSEAKHHATFLRLAKRFATERAVEQRLHELCAIEHEVLTALPYLARLH